jgi:hypothetical protein
VTLTQERLALLDADKDPVRVALVLAELAHRAWASADWPLARSANQRALDLIPSDSPERVAIMTHRAGLAMLSSRHREALRYAREVLPVAQEADDTDSYARGLMVLGISAVGTGHVEEGLMYLRRHMALAEGTRVPRTLGVNYANHTEALVWVDRPDEALVLADEGIARADEFGFTFYLLLILGNRVRALAELSRWDEALDTTHDPTDRGADPFTRLPVDQTRADLYLKRGDVAAAAALLAPAAATLAGQDDVQFGTELSALQALVASRESRWADARAAVREGLRVALSADNQHRVARLTAIGVRVEADAALDDSAARADEILADGEAHLAALTADDVVPLPRTQRWLALARAERTRLGTPDAAAWAAVVAIAAHDRYLRGYARFREAEALLLTRGARQQAVTALTEAAAIATELGAAPLAEDVRVLAERARLTLPAAPAAQAEARRPGPHERRDRGGAVHQHEDGERPRVEHPAQARAAQPHPGRRGGAAARSGIGDVQVGEPLRPEPCLAVLAERVAAVDERDARQLRAVQERVDVRDLLRVQHGELTQLGQRAEDGAVDLRADPVEAHGRQRRHRRQPADRERAPGAPDLQDLQRRRQVVEDVDVLQVRQLQVPQRRQVFELSQHVLADVRVQELQRRQRVGDLRQRRRGQGADPHERPQPRQDDVGREWCGGHQTVRVAEHERPHPFADRARRQPDRQRRGQRQRLQVHQIG